jgi:glycosyltransferase involved in cell wall biosynthesis
MSRKLELLAANPDLNVWHICPREWRDELIQVRQASGTSGYRQIPVSLSRPSDPHRAWYHSTTFEMTVLKPNIIHAEEEPDSIAALQIATARRLFAPHAKLLLYTWQNVDRRLKAYVKSIMRFTLNNSDGVLCANSKAQRLLRGRGYEKFSAVVPAIGVDTRVFVPGPRVSSPVFTIAFIGRLVVEKGLDTLIDAVAELAQRPGGRAVRLLIVGDGPYRADLERHVHKLGPVAKFVGPQYPAQVATLLQGIDALVLPSRSTPVWKEQFGRVLIEAMACRVPVIGSDSGAIPEVIGDVGLIFPEGDASALARCLSRLIDSADLQHDLAERGYARAMQHYTQQRIADQTADCYRQLLSDDTPTD